MGRADYESVLEEMRLADGTPFPLPVTLTVGKKDARLRLGGALTFVRRK
jgi:sulfate adenylyltransferase